MRTDNNRDQHVVGLRSYGLGDRVSGHHPGVLLHALLLRKSHHARQRDVRAVLAVALNIGVPPLFAALELASTSNLFACLTHRRHGAGAHSLHQRQCVAWTAVAGKEHEEHKGPIKRRALVERRSPAALLRQRLALLDVGRAFPDPTGYAACHL